MEPLNRIRVFTAKQEGFSYGIVVTHFCELLVKYGDHIINLFMNRKCKIVLRMNRFGLLPCRSFYEDIYAYGSTTLCFPLGNARVTANRIFWRDSVVLGAQGKHRVVPPW